MISALCICHHQWKTRLNHHFFLRCLSTYIYFKILSEEVLKNSPKCAGLLWLSSQTEDTAVEMHLTDNCRYTVLSLFSSRSWSVSGYFWANSKSNFLIKNSIFVIQKSKFWDKELHFFDKRSIFWDQVKYWDIKIKILK